MATSSSRRPDKHRSEGISRLDGAIRFTVEKNGFSCVRIIMAAFRAVEEITGDPEALFKQVRRLIDQRLENGEW